jgi:hypothetical protein
VITCSRRGLALTARRIQLPAITVLLLVLLLVALVPSAARAGFGKKAECPVEQVFLEDVSIRHKKEVDPDEILPEYVDRLEIALQKAGFTLAGSEDALGDEGVSLQVTVRAWTSRARTTGRVTRELGATVRVLDDGERLWVGEVGPGEFSRMVHLNNSSPKNLAKQTARLVVNACRAGWTTP